MSEIFDFLRKTEAGRGKKNTVPSTVIEPPPMQFADAPVQEEPLPIGEPLSFEEPFAATEPLALEVESSGTGKFDLKRASYQAKSVMDPLTIVGEQFRLLRTKLDLMQKQRGIKVLLVTSSVPQEGKTFTFTSAWPVCSPRSKAKKSF